MLLFYICMMITKLFVCAGNSAGQSNKNVSIAASKEDKDYFYTNTQVSSVAPTITSKSRTSKPHTYLLTWNPGLNLVSVNFYKIRYRKVSSSSWKYETVFANATMLFLRNLESASLYEVEMVEVLRSNQASQLAISSFRTGSAKPSKKPFFNTTDNLPSSDVLHSSFQPKDKNVKEIDKKHNQSNVARVPDAPYMSLPFLSDTSSTAVSLTWHPRWNGGSPITGYKIQVRRVGGGRNRWRNIESALPADSRTYNVNGLKRGHSYKFRIFAINDVGESEASQSTSLYSIDSLVLRKPLVAPRITDIHLKNESLIIQWTYDEIDMDSLDGFLMKYSTEEKRQKKRFRNPSIVSYAIDKPRHNVLYSVKMQAYNVIGKSPESPEIQFEIVWDHAAKQNKVVLDTPLDSSYLYDGGLEKGNATDVHVVNTKKETSLSQRETAFIIAGSTVGFVIIILLYTVIIYRRKLTFEKILKKPVSV